MGWRGLADHVVQGSQLCRLLPATDHDVPTRVMPVHWVTPCAIRPVIQAAFAEWAQAVTLEEGLELGVVHAVAVTQMVGAGYRVDALAVIAQAALERIELIQGRLAPRREACRLAFPAAVGINRILFGSAILWVWHQEKGMCSGGRLTYFQALHHQPSLFIEHPVPHRFAVRIQPHFPTQQVAFVLHDPALFVGLIPLGGQATDVVIFVARQWLGSTGFCY
ncbi:hypothetical protein D3C80_1338970 [compost metagenome]